MSDADVNTEMQNIYSQLTGTQSDLIKFLHQNYGSEIGIPEFQTWIKESLVEAAVKQQLLEHAQVRHILIAVPASATPDEVEAARQKVLDIKAKITSLDQFGDVAKQYSEDVASADKGGELGITVRGDDSPVFSSDFENALFTLPVGTISDPVRSSYGWHIIEVESRSGTIKESLKTYTTELRSSGVHIFLGK